MAPSNRDERGGAAAPTAAFLPAAMQGARTAGVRRSWGLMPLAFASTLGGMSFLYGTSTSLVVSTRLQELGLGRIGVLEPTPAGLPVALLGISSSCPRGGVGDERRG